MQTHQSSGAAVRQLQGAAARGSRPFCKKAWRKTRKSARRGEMCVVNAGVPRTVHAGGGGTNRLCRFPVFPRGLFGRRGTTKITACPSRARRPARSGAGRGTLGVYCGYCMQTTGAKTKSGESAGSAEAPEPVQRGMRVPQCEERRNYRACKCAWAVSHKALRRGAGGLFAKRPGEKPENPRGGERCALSMPACRALFMPAGGGQTGFAAFPFSPVAFSGGGAQRKSQPVHPAPGAPPVPAPDAGCVGRGGKGRTGCKRARVYCKKAVPAASAKKTGAGSRSGDKKQRLAVRSYGRRNAMPCVAKAGYTEVSAIYKYTDKHARYAGISAPAVRPSASSLHICPCHDR